VLETDSVRVEVTAAPYSYSVIEKATGLVLVTNSQTQFTVGTARTVSEATIVGQTATTLDATLTLAGTPDTAHIKWTMVDPDVSRSS
jgi:hypothetical protein